MDTLALEAAKHAWAYVRLLDHLLEAEVSAGYQRDVAMQTKLAHFPLIKAVGQFEVELQPAINERRLREPATRRIITNGENGLLGQPGWEGSSGDCAAYDRYLPGRPRLLHHWRQLSGAAAPSRQ